MGGDKVPEIPILGGIEALKEFGDKIELFFVGKKSEILKVIGEKNIAFPLENIINADDVIEMKESPANALRSKPFSSINISLDLILQKKADAFVSAGNTGAVSSGSLLKLGRIQGISRPTIGTLIPTQIGKTMLFDIGAFVDSKPKCLVEFGLMGSIFMKHIYGITNPRIGLLNVGEEKSKGNELTKAAYGLFEQSKLNFVGNVEGRDILKGEVDIIVCDGFVGNIILKFAEGFLSFLKSKIKNYSEQSFLNKLKAGIVKITLKDVLKSFDYQLYGGVPLLGIKGITIIGHGSSSPLAIKNMILRASEVFEKQVPDKIEKAIKDNLLNEGNEKLINQKED